MAILKDLLNNVFAQRNIDFSQYREKLIERRVNVRIRATKSNSLKDYINYLKQNRSEMDALLNVLTINVTSFFRDINVFQAIEQKVLPELFLGLDKNNPIIRIWSCGCSGGQEATSILIMLLEFFQDKEITPSINIFGTDIDEWSIEKAKEGIYLESEIKNIPKRLLNKYFLDMGNKKYWRKKELNKYLFFKHHDIVKEKHLRRMDLVLCRNVFIYFKQELQLDCIMKYLKALNSNGFLVLGITESLYGSSYNMFREFDIKNRIFQKESSFVQ
jgi:chemotaxis protein methyltransferase CheR